MLGMWSLLYWLSLALQLGCVECSIFGIINPLQMMLEEKGSRQECLRKSINNEGLVKNGRQEDNNEVTVTKNISSIFNVEKQGL